MKYITVKNTDLEKCPECGGELQYQQEWDRLFDSYSDKFPQMILATKKLLEEREPKYICSDCKTGILVSP